MGHKIFWSIFYWLFESMYATLALFSLCLCTPMPYTGPSFCCGKNHESDVSLFLKIMMVQQFILFLFLDSHIIMASLWC